MPPKGELRVHISLNKILLRVMLARKQYEDSATLATAKTLV
jgi:hypothetical protein